MSDDPLDGLLGSLRRKAPASQENDKGLNPVDLLALPRAQRDLVNWLARRKQAHFEEIQAALKLEAAALSAELVDLKNAGYIHEALVEGQIFYRVIFRGKVSRGGRSLPDHIWSRVDLDNSTFLQQIPLFRRLNIDQIRDVTNKLEARRYHRNEVILWQGGLGEGIYIIKNGIVGITRLVPHLQNPQILAYLKQGDLLGEYSMLADQTSASSATATALSEVDVLLMKRDNFLNLLETHNGIALELARILVQRLNAMNTRLTGSAADSLVTLVFGIGAGAGCTTIGSALATTLSRMTQQAVVYTEHPDPDQLPPLFGFTPGAEVSTQPCGYDILVPQGTAGLPATVRTTLLMDRVMGNYSHIVIGISSELAETPELDETVIYLLEQADQVVLVAPPDASSWEQINALSARLKLAIRPDKTSQFIVCNRTTEQQAHLPQAGRVDFDIPFLPELPPLPERAAKALPNALIDVTAILTDRMGRTNQIGVYIPTTIGVDASADTSSYVNRTLAFLGKLFGGATSNQAQGVWNSDQVGLVSEQVYVVRTYVTKADMDHYLGQVLEFVEQLKQELQQEAMALEVNQKMMLI